MNRSFVRGLILHWRVETAKPFPTTHFIHFDSSFIFPYFIFFYNTVLHLIRYVG